MGREFDGADGGPEADTCLLPVGGAEIDLRALTFEHEGLQGDRWQGTRLAVLPTHAPERRAMQSAASQRIAGEGRIVELALPRPQSARLWPRPLHHAKI